MFLKSTPDQKPPQTSFASFLHSSTKKISKQTNFPVEDKENILKKISKLHHDPTGKYSTNLPATSDYYSLDTEVTFSRPLRRSVGKSTNQEEVTFPLLSMNKKGLGSYKPSPSMSGGLKRPLKTQYDMESTAMKTPVNRDDIDSGDEFEYLGDPSSERFMMIEQEPALNEGKTTPRKRYNLFEDWRILETVEHHIRRFGLTGIQSKNFWETIQDPATKRPLLNGERTGESLRTRYRKFLMSFTENDLKEMRRFAKEMSPQEMSNYYCLPIKTSGKTSAKKASLTKNYPLISTKKALSFMTPEQEEDYPGLIPQVLTPRFEAMFENGADSTEGESEIMKKQVKSNIRDRKASAGRNSVQSKGKGSLQKYDIMQDLVKKPNPLKVIDFRDVIDESGKKRSFEQTFSENNSMNTIFDRRKVKKAHVSNEDLELQNLKERALYTNQRAFEQLQGSNEEYHVGRPEERFVEETAEEEGNSKNFNTDLWILVDCNKEKRQFYDKSEESGVRGRLARIAKEYGVELSQLLRFYHALSDDYEDLMDYLNTGDERLVWSPSDDKGLLNEDRTALYYLRMIKGEANMEKRRAYLLKKPGMNRSRYE